MIYLQILGVTPHAGILDIFSTLSASPGGILSERCVDMITAAPPHWLRDPHSKRYSFTVAVQAYTCRVARRRAVQAVVHDLLFPSSLATAEAIHRSSYPGRCSAHFDTAVAGSAPLHVPLT